MPYNPHMRLSLTGTLPDEEQFSCNLSLTYNDNPIMSTILERMSDQTFLGNDWLDLVADCEAFWKDVNVGICAGAVLKRVKLAPIGADGLYAGPPLEAAVNAQGSNGALTDNLPHQISRKVTLETDGDLGRIKGGFYLPMVSQTGWNRTTDLTDVTYVEYMRAAVKSFLDDVENAPGLDTSGFKVVIASQGRHNKDGSVRVAGGNHKVKRVNIGRRLDVQRRRANKLSEARIADAALAQQG